MNPMWGYIAIAVALVFFLLYLYGTYLDRHPDKHPERKAELRVEEKLQGRFNADAERQYEAGFRAGARTAQMANEPALAFTCGWDGGARFEPCRNPTPTDAVYCDEHEPADAPEEPPVTEPIPVEVIASINAEDDLQAWKDAGNTFPPGVLEANPELAAQWLGLR